MRMVALLICTLFTARLAHAQDIAPLPPGVSAVWDLGQAQRIATPTRERICINGLWRWQPADAEAHEIPSARWGFFKVPGAWPGITDYMQKDSQAVIPHASWAGQRLGAITAAWYQREITIPPEWTGRRIALAADYVNSLATIFIDGTRAGDIRFPGGELDVTSLCRPGSTHLLSVHVAALPLKAVLLSFADTNNAREIKSRVARRGFCGDVFLISTPVAERINDVKIDPSVRRREITFDLALQDLRTDRRYVVQTQIARQGQPVATFTSPAFGAADLSADRYRFTSAWLPDALWDVHTPQNMFEARCTLRELDGRVCDTQLDVPFGFREFWIEGRDFYLNGTRLTLSAVPLDNALVGPALACYAGARESLRRLKAIGINFVYTHNYGCTPGSHLGFDEILRAADDVGMLVAVSQPHFSHYEWKEANADTANGYAAHAAFYVRIAQNHPAVVAYSMNHNATGYGEDMNPDLIDGVSNPRTRPAQQNARLALRAETIVRRFDASRVTYHHSSGNLGAMHTNNFYTNFVPPQELSDWFEHWATTGVKPVFLVEYGAPFTWDWAMYRGWYKGERAFGEAEVPWQVSFAEWNAQFIGDRAYENISTPYAEDLRWEAKQLRAGKVWHRWDYPRELSSRDFDERYPIYARYLSDNWPAFRTWGVSAISPWEFGHFWKLRPGVDKRRQALPVDWAHLQRPGFSPDFIGERYERMDLAFAPEDWVATPAAEALLRYNQPLLAWIAGKAAAFTSKDHVFTPGETFEKQLIVINNSRVPVTAKAAWSLALPAPLKGDAHLSLAPGEQQRVPLRFALPKALATGEYPLQASITFSTGEAQSDAFSVHVIAPIEPPGVRARIALFDPRGETRALLDRIGIACEPVGVGDDLARYDLLVVGKQALSVDGPAPDIQRVRGGLNVLLFEQTSAVLEKRFGFRVTEYGLRQAFARVPDHPALKGVTDIQLRDWRGEATLLPPRLTYETKPRFGPVVKWCDIPVTRLWRCGNRGNVGSVLIEKPACGDFLPIVDGGFELQYSPLLEYREGRGRVVFCQLDLCGRSEPEPVTATLARNLIQSMTAPTAAVTRRALYVGEPAIQQHLAAAGFVVEPYASDPLAASDLLIVAPGAPAANAPNIREFLQRGGRMVALGLNQSDLDALLPVAVGTTSREHIACYFEPAPFGSAFQGVASADVMNRDPRALPLVTRGADVLGDGVLASAAQGHVVLCQMVPWQFDPAKLPNLKRTFRRATFLVTRLLANAGAPAATPVLDRFHSPATAATERRWSHGLYLDQPEEWDDPYRFFRW